MYPITPRTSFKESLTLMSRIQLLLSQVYKQDQVLIVLYMYYYNMFRCLFLRYRNEHVWNTRHDNKTLLVIWRCPWCNGYRRRMWTRRHEFKSWTNLITFHIALIPLGKVWLQIFSLQLWVNSRADKVLQPWWGD